MLSACSQKTHRIISPGGGAAGVPKPQARLEQGLGTARSPQLLRGACVPPRTQCPGFSLCRQLL